jgi:parallel beta-helix repeat protein
VSNNTASGNTGPGIQLIQDAIQNTVQGNTFTRNYFGILVGNYGFGDGSRNTIQNNTANLNVIGIVVQQGTGNTLQGNTALSNANIDLEDDNPNCDSNTWANNKFVTDNVVGVPDGGPGTGCIR